MDSINQGATIRIGLEKDTQFGSSFWTPTYSLKIDKKSFLIAEGGGGRNEYLDIYQNAAKEIAQIMNEKGIKDYIIYNGERVGMFDKKWVSCDYVSNDIEELFKKTLKQHLDGVQ